MGFFCLFFFFLFLPDDFDQLLLAAFKLFNIFLCLFEFLIEFVYFLSVTKFLSFLTVFDKLSKFLIH